MSRITLDLCHQLLVEYHGEIVANIGTILLQNKQSSLPIITKLSGLDSEKVKQALSSLVQQNIVTFSQKKPGIFEYEASPNAIRERLHFPQYIHCAKMLYGDAAELLVEELLLQGQSHLDSAVEKTTAKLNEALASSGSSLPPISSSVVKDKVTTLVKARLIRRCYNVIRDVNDKIISTDNSSQPEELFRLPTLTDYESKPGKKRPIAESSEPTGKRMKMEKGISTQIVTSEGTGIEPSFWCVNVHQFHHHFRDQAIVASVARAIDQRASDVMRTMLRLSQTKSDPTSPTSQELSLNEISNAMPKDKALLRGMLEQYLKCLSENCSNFVTKVGESGGGMYQINYFKAVKAICVSHIETVVLERFGSKALRMFRVIMEKNHIEQKQVEEKAMLDPKEAKEILYKMFAENFVTLTELSKTPDHAPSRTFYLFHVNLIQVSRMLLERSYKAMANVLVKRQKCISENKRLLDKEERVEAIIASLDAEGAVEQKEEVEQMITPSEKSQLTKVREANKRLEQSEIQLDKTVFILETYLAYTLRPPQPKRM